MKSEKALVQKVPSRTITSIRRVASRPVKCIAVDSPSHLYLAGRELLPVHNSSVLLNIVGHTAHLNPANILIIQPTLSEAEDFSKARLAKFIRDCKALTPLFYEKERTRDANNTILSKFFKGGRIILVGANSSSGLASRPIKILLCDEVDRYPASASGNEGDPISLAEKRLTTFFRFEDCHVFNANGRRAKPNRLGVFAWNARRVAA
ncbi:MAG: phage terminase large subunit family protein [Selenomonadaceae bacterium]|nr:phage terminase large subunit family protein [Selenomonadaceae bacterium]